MKSKPIKSKYSYETFEPINKSKKGRVFIIIFVILVAISIATCFFINVLTDKQHETSKANVNTARMGSNAQNNGQKNTDQKSENKKAKVADKFELPVSGATGFASVSMPVKTTRDDNSKIEATLKAGEGFQILKEKGHWWRIKTGDIKGWVSSKYCMINLPDIIPSIVYDNTNSYSSVFRSSGKDIPGLTGEKLYDAITLNDRFGENLPLMPVIYSMSKKIHKAQKAAIKNNETIVLVESYRPYEIQRKVVDGLSSLMAADVEVNGGINQSPWSKSWFVSTGKSNHQRGTAVDITLAKIEKSKKVWVGDYLYNKTIKYIEYKMPSPIHELSVKAVSFSRPFKSLTSEWKEVSPSENMNEHALRLQEYCTNSGLIPLASEWWHFDDADSLEKVADNKSEGGYFVTGCYSRI